MTETRPIVALVRDLMFSSRISSAAREMNVACTIVRDPQRLADTPPGGLLLVDLNQPGAIEAAAEYSRTHGVPAIGFVSHVDEQTISQARSAGIDQIVTRGQFTQRLADLILPAPNATQGTD